MQLKELFNKYGCDKSTKHGYDTVYQKLFEPLQDKEINILEVGIFKGASTSAFYEFFPKANIYALDIFVRTKAKLICDRTDGLVLSAFNQWQRSSRRISISSALVRTKISNA